MVFKKAYSNSCYFFAFHKCLNLTLATFLVKKIINSNSCYLFSNSINQLLLQSSTFLSLSLITPSLVNPLLSVLSPALGEPNALCLIPALGSQRWADSADAEILGDPYYKKSVLPSIGNFPHLANSPKLSSYQVLSQSRIQQRHATCYNQPRIDAQ